MKVEVGILEFQIEQYRAHSVFRNPIIANILYKSSDPETYSSRIRRIYEECTQNNVKVEFRKEK